MSIHSALKSHTYARVAIAAIAIAIAANAGAKGGELSRYQNAEKLAKAHIATFDTLDFDVFTHQKWDRLKEGNLRTLKAYRLYLALRDIWDYTPAFAPAALGRWISWALRSRVEPMVKAARTIRQHVKRILRVLTNDLTTAVMEGINSLVQAARAGARGYRNVHTFITVIYLIAGKLDLRFAHTK